MCAFFISSRRRHTRFKCDWSSDVCSSDLVLEDREFHPKLGGLESRERAPKLFVAQVLAAAQRAGHVGRSWPAQTPAGHTRAGRGRGGVAARRAAERRLHRNPAPPRILTAR